MDGWVANVPCNRPHAHCAGISIVAFILNSLDRLECNAIRLGGWESRNFLALKLVSRWMVVELTCSLSHVHVGPH